MKDIQMTTDNHKHIEIQDVGISNIKYPIYITQKDNDKQHSVGIFQMSVLLKPDQKGTHMSRFISVLESLKNAPIGWYTLKPMAQQILQKLETSKCTIKCEFPYFILKEAPISKNRGLVDYNIIFGLIYKNDDTNEFSLTVDSPGTSLCPCSKEISDYGAHNQRSRIKVKLVQENSENIIWIEDVVNIIEKNISCPIYSILKREDEKFVTEHAYSNPMFCEDIVRNIADEINNNYNNIKYKIEVFNIESIHNHDAYAMIKNY